MDSLLATYASSDEEAEEEKQESHQPPAKSLQRSNPPKSSSLFSFLPPPIASPSTSIITDHSPSAANHNRPAKPSSLFSSLPLPKSENPNSAPSGPKPKKVVQFRPPINLISKSNDDDDDEEEDYGKQRRNSESITHTPSVKSFLSSIPAPKNAALGSLSMSSGTGRRSIIIDADAATWNSNASGISTEANVSSNISEQSIGASDGSLEYTVSGDASDRGLGSEQYVNYETYGGYDGGGGDASSLVSASGDYANYDSYSGGYGNYETEGHYDYESKWVDKSDASVEPDVSRVAAENVVRVPSKRGRKDVLPDEMIEVKQDELMKNRPREDKAKLTGIAFGPSYQMMVSAVCMPVLNILEEELGLSYKGIRIGNFNSADTSVGHYSQRGILESYGWEMPVSAKGKPTKLHKRKHQIGSLYFDMKQKEMELSERRSKGFLTKAETQAKYGW
ncbi:hypothetical protein RJ640_025322 [Escallonia rubra]|uniref:Proline-rich protein PRCC n=1 Tax=Escallonia rubra TaxID=112253 RepID=A0AA88QG20_9ASTE|nr:hypothetical protein RJ640_025322 [Escallonia rubra]